jgi:hypothetical protein
MESQELPHPLFDEVLQLQRTVAEKRREVERKISDLKQAEFEKLVDGVEQLVTEVLPYELSKKPTSYEDYKQALFFQLTDNIKVPTKEGYSELQAGRTKGNARFDVRTGFSEKHKRVVYSINISLLYLSFARPNCPSRLRSYRLEDVLRELQGILEEFEWTIVAD